MASVHSEVDQCQYPSILTFLPPDTYREVVEQQPPDVSDVTVGFPMRVDYQDMEEMVKVDRCKLFLAQPPPCTIPYDSMTDIQRWPVDLGTDMKHQILHLSGKAGSGKTQVALTICELFQGRVQAAAVTGKAALLLGVPIVHGMFRWGTYDKSNHGYTPKISSRKDTELRTFYENVDVFVADEVNAMSARMLAEMHETMTTLFNPKLVKVRGNLLPFGSKKMVFLGDPAQLKPVVGEAIFDGGNSHYGKVDRACSARGRRQAMYHMSAKGQELYRKYLEPNCVILCKAQKSSGLLQQIYDRLRNGLETDDDRRLLMRQSINFPDCIPDFMLHYDNESCSATNWRHLWSECRSADPPKGLYICRASYCTASDNHVIVDGLAALPSPVYNFASDVTAAAAGEHENTIRT